MQGHTIDNLVHQRERVVAEHEWTAMRGWGVMAVGVVAALWSPMVRSSRPVADCGVDGVSDHCDLTPRNGVTTNAVCLASSIWPGTCPIGRVPGSAAREPAREVAARPLGTQGRESGTARWTFGPKRATCGSWKAAARAQLGTVYAGKIDLLVQISI